MKTFIYALMTIFMVGLFSESTFAQCGSHHKKQVKSSYHHRGDIVDIAASDDNFSTLVAAVKAADLVEALKAEGPFTVFAPLNSAFDRLPDGTVANLLKPSSKSTLTAILTYHVVAGDLTAQDIIGAIKTGGGKATLTTLQGGKLEATLINGEVFLIDETGNKSLVTQTNINASNGIIHAIDMVVMPKI